MTVQYNLLTQRSMIKKSTNLEDGATSSKNMKITVSQQVPTQGKEYRDFEYTVYEQTNFQSYKTQYFTICDKIRSQRLMEHLGRYKLKESKTHEVNMFKGNLSRLKELLLLMTKEADRYKTLIVNNGSTKQVKSTNVSCDYEMSFRKKIRKDLKDVQTWWIELFIEGSLKRLTPVLNLLRIPDDEVNFGLDITQWHIETQFKFSTYQRTSSLCCCV